MISQADPTGVLEPARDRFRGWGAALTVALVLAMAQSASARTTVYTDSTGADSSRVLVDEEKKLYNELLRKLESPKAKTRLVAAKRLATWPGNQDRTAQGISNALAIEKNEGPATAMIRALVTLGTDKSFQYLEKSMVTLKDPKIKMELLEATKSVADKTIESIWNKAIRDSSARVQSKAITVMSKSKLPVAKVLIISASKVSEFGNIRALSVIILGTKKGLEQDRLVDEYWKDKFPEVRIAVLKVITSKRSGQGSGQESDLLLKGLHDSSRLVRLYAIRQTSRYYLDNSNLVAELITLGRHESDTEIRTLVLDSLARVTPRTETILQIFLGNLKTNSRPARLKAIAGLRRYGHSPKAVQALGALRSDKEDQLRLAAVEALIEIRTREAVDLIQPFLSDRDEDVFNTTLSGLGNIGDRRSIDIIKKVFALNARNENKMLLTIQALRGIGGIDAIRLLRSKLALGNKDPNIRNIAAMAIAAHPSSDNAMIKALGKQLKKEEEEKIKLRLIEALGKIKSPRSEKVLAAVLRDSSFSVVRAAVQALYGSSNQKLVPNFLPILANRRLVQDALRTLGSIGGPKAAAYMIRFLKHKDKHVSSLAIQAIAECGLEGEDRDKYITLFIKHYQTLRAKKPGSRESVATVKAIGILGGDRATDYLKQLISDKELHSAVLKETLAGLARMKDPQALDIAYAFLQDRNASMRKSGLNALAELGGTPAVNVLRQLLVKARATDQKLIIKTLARLTDVEGVPDDLVTLLKLEDRTGVTKVLILNALGRLEREDLALKILPYMAENLPIPTQLAASRAMGNYKLKEAIPLLIKNLDSDNAGLRKASLQSLERMTNFTFGRFTTNWSSWWERHKDNSIETIVSKGFRSHNFKVGEDLGSEDKSDLIRALKAYEQCCRFNAIRKLKQLYEGDDKGYDFRPQYHHPGVIAWAEED